MSESEVQMQNELRAICIIGDPSAPDSAKEWARTYIKRRVCRAQEDIDYWRSLLNGG